MKHTPIGYDIVNGMAVINEEEAEQIKTLFAGYLMGLSFKAAASLAGFTGMNHSSAKGLIQNRKYLGTEYYPQIMDEETFNAAQEERLRREKVLGRSNIPKKEKPVSVFYTRFKIYKVDQRYEDPLKQAVYAYSKVKEVE